MYSLSWIVALSACLWSAAHGYQLSLRVNDVFEIDGSTVYASNTASPLTVQCKYDVLLRNDPPHLVLLSSDGSVVNSALPVMLGALTLSYAVPLEYRHGVYTYRCQAPDHTYVQITVSYNPPPTSSPPPSTHPSTHPPTHPSTHPSTARPSTHPSTHTPTHPSTARPSTHPSTSSGSSFTGLNPLIYTISAVILLGSLAIVAIITCWIRARRSFNNRSLRSAQTAQDYFDFLSDSEFTPLTSEEFQASLQERPPTYHQSEQLESQPEASETEPETEDTAVDTTPPSAENPVSPREAALIENLIALDLLPENHRPSRHSSSRPSPCQSLSGQTGPFPSLSSSRPSPRQSLSGQTGPSPSLSSSRPSPSQGRRLRVRLPALRRTTQRCDDDCEQESTVSEQLGDEVDSESLERLRVVGAQAQRLLEEKRSEGELVSLDTAESASPTPDQIEEIESTVEQFTSHMTVLMERGREMDRRFQDSH